MNKVIEIGRLTAHPALEQTQNGKSKLPFCIAVNRRFKQDGKREADFIDCVAWDKTAEFIARNFTKGDSISIVGALRTRLYEDKQGNKRKSTEVYIEEAEFCGSRAKADGAEAEAEPTAPNYEEVKSDDELPF